MATIDLGKIKMVWRGAYNNATAYTIDDAVSLNGTSYICIAATTGNTPPNATYWNVLAQGRTDLGATLSNNQIAIKNNSGNIAGVNIGNAGEFLKVSSGATGYEFGAVSSDYVLLSDTSVSNAAHIQIDVFSATYKIYKVFIGGAYATSNGYSSELRLNNKITELLMLINGLFPICLTIQMKQQITNLLFLILMMQVSTQVL